MRHLSGPLALVLLTACGGADPLAVWTADPTEGATETGSTAVIVVPNLDDDDQDGQADWLNDGGAAGDDDRATLQISNKARATTLRLTGDTDGVRIYQGNLVVLGEGAATSWALPDRRKTDSITLSVEAGAWGPLATLQVVDDKKDVVDEIPIVGVAPTMGHHLLPSERFWVLQVGEPGWSNQSMIDALSAGLSTALTVLDGPTYGWDIWVQDEPEVLRFWTPDSQATVILDSIRDGNGEGGLDPFPETLIEPDVFVNTLGAGNWATTYDAFGNLEVSPPVTVDGEDFPLGRVYYGWNGTTAEGGPNQQLRDWLDRAQVQKPFYVDTTWLCVGHIDEVTTFVPDPTAPRGFRFLVSDTKLGWQILDAMEGGTVLDRHRLRGWDGHGRANVSAYTNDAALRAYNAEIMTRHLEPIIETFRTELDLTDEEIVRTPALFEEYAEDGYVCGGLATVPGVVNLLMETDETGEGGVAWMPDPFIRPPGSTQDDDPWIAAWTDLLPATVEARFVDDWTVYHMGMGEVHCGTNQERVPALSTIDLATWIQEVAQ